MKLFLFTAALSLPFGQFDEAEICLDVSGSMTASKLGAAKEGAKLFTAIVGDQHRVRVIAFSGQVNCTKSFSLKNGQRSVNQWIDGLQCGGQTNYLEAIRALPAHGSATVIFLSDGEDNGSASEVLREVSSRPELRIHTIAVGCQPSSPAAELLSKMAAKTRASFTHADSAEAIVRQFVRIALRQGRYRGHAPGTRTVQLGTAGGPVMAFAYDGKAAFKGVASVDREHTASLPDETVHMAVTDSAQCRSVTIQLESPQTKDSRLGEVYVRCLPMHEFRLAQGCQGGCRPGSPVGGTFEFSNENGHAVNPKQPGVSAEFRIVDSEGKAVGTAKAVPSSHGAGFSASLAAPAKPGTYKIVASSAWPMDGKSFGQSSEHVLVVKQPKQVALGLDPQRWSGQHPPGTFSRTSTLGQITPRTSSKVFASFTNPTNGLAIKSSGLSDGGLSIHFDAEKEARYRGELDIRIEDGLKDYTATLPYDFDVKRPLNGLTIPDLRRISLGRVFAGSGARQTELIFPTADKRSTRYRLALNPLSSDSDTILLRGPVNFDTSAKQAGRAKVRYIVGNVPAGEYDGVAVATSPELAGREWKTQLRLRVDEPLSARPIHTEAVIGRSTTFTVEISNQSQQPISDVSLELPLRLTDRSGKRITGVQFETRRNTHQANGNSVLRIPVKVTAHSSMTNRGRFDGVIRVLRSGHKALDVPVTVDVLRPTDIPIFVVAPKRIRVAAPANGLGKFQLKVTPLTNHKGSTRLSAEFTLFRRDGKAATGVVPSIKWKRQSIRGPKGTASLNATLLAPQQAGTYTGKIRVTATSGHSLEVPVTLVVE